ncbi:hypothetical protein MPTK1_1g14380 [Marchantia polymorpha subsp. ruderalis]|uniref:Uncharacterized protein n=2 Tax=Marchantia polymorpha TaxID=3197 RepID=A0AAF6AQ33_MARPO|nr:hypothetical protein MARPO_0179s0019 [Marchantia polymorpha]BBM98553.1 hypothetical protein Mp_1g14380 [Marchantia polymorpha subsp. ruderalis]|eukprot:PTQ27934.1 hypothetical protein MARPO_0179s0019 [Marchantia polymorpha]
MKRCDFTLFSTDMGVAGSLSPYQGVHELGHGEYEMAMSRCMRWDGSERRTRRQMKRTAQGQGRGMIRSSTDMIGH